jgi:hypothetical protein
MSTKRINHFIGGILGKYIGHSEVHDDGEIYHFEDDGSIMPGEKYVGYSKGEKATHGGGGGGGGGDIPGLGFILIILSPLLLLIGLIALSAVVYVGPFYWLFSKYFKKRGAAGDSNKRPRFVGVWWVILAFFIILIGLLYTIFLIGAFITAPHLIFSPGEKPGELILFWLQIFWGICLLLFARDIIRNNSIGGVVTVFVVFGGLWALGNFLAFKNPLGPVLQITSAFRPMASNSNPSFATYKKQASAVVTTDGSRDSGDQNADMPQISNISTVLPLQPQTITVQGHGFGTRPPYTGDSDFIRVTNVTNDWNAGSSKDYPPDEINLSITSWTDTEIVISGFGGAYGYGHYRLNPWNAVRFQVWNAKTGRGPANYSVVVAADTAQN